MAASEAHCGGTETPLIISTTLVFHAFWSVDPEAAQDQMIQFLKNLAMMGGMLYIVVHGPGPLSLDQK